MTIQKNSKDTLFLQAWRGDEQLCWSKSPQGHSGYYNWEKMMGLGFEEDQQNSLDILIKFQDEHQHPESHTDEELFLPLTQISVTSHPHPPQQHTQDSGQVEELVMKMRMACEEQEGKIGELLSGTDGRKGGVRMAVGRSGFRIPEEEDVPSKRKIIRKRHML